jgi:hypothetical protein
MPTCIESVWAYIVELPISSWLKPSCTWVADALNSNLTTAFIGSVAGAYGGAWAAQRISERAKVREELQKEIRSASAAAILIYGIASRHIGLKQQHVQGMRDRFFEQQTEFSLYLKAMEAGTVPHKQEFKFEADYQTLKPMHAPTEVIEKLVFEQVSLSGAIFLGTQTLLAVMKALNECIEDRNQLIQNAEAASKTNGKSISPFRYFGFPDENRVDQRFMQVTEGIYSQTDDVIAYATKIADQLYAHAIETRAELRIEFKVQGPDITKLDFSHLQQFLPPQENYTEAFKMFLATSPKPAPRSASFWRRFMPSRREPSKTQDVEN